MDENLADRPNADYLFEKPDLIAELKCFEKDVFSGKEDFPKMERLLTKWTNKKMITGQQLCEYILRTSTSLANPISTPILVIAPHLVTFE